MNIQQELDKEIQEYLKNPNNSVSGEAFNELLLNLQLIKIRWDEHCRKYNGNWQSKEDNSELAKQIESLYLHPSAVVSKILSGPLGTKEIYFHDKEFALLFRIGYDIVLQNGNSIPIIGVCPSLGDGYAFIVQSAHGVKENESISLRRKS